MVVLGLVLDLATKYLGWIFLGGPPEEGGYAVTVIPGWLQLVAGRNPGIVFGFDFGEYLGLGAMGGRIVTILLMIGTSALIFYVFAISHITQQRLHLWCGLILAGAFGNLYDRLVYGFVRDFIQITAHAEIGGTTLQWPWVFNLADVYLVLGVAVVVLSYLFGARPPDEMSHPKHPGKDA